MKSIALVTCLAGLALAAPATNNEVPKILKYEYENDGLGSYRFFYETSDGISRREEGTIKNAGDPEKSILVVIGSYSYTGPDGKLYKVDYTADENGFHPTGAHLPETPLVPSDPNLQGIFTPSPLIPAFLPPAVVASLLG